MTTACVRAPSISDQTLTNHENHNLPSDSSSSSSFLLPRPHHPDSLDIRNRSYLRNHPIHPHHPFANSIGFLPQHRCPAKVDRRTRPARWWVHYAIDCPLRQPEHHLRTKLKPWRRTPGCRSATSPNSLQTCPPPNMIPKRRSHSPSWAREKQGMLRRY